MRLFTLYVAPVLCSALLITTHVKAEAPDYRYDIELQFPDSNYLSLSPPKVSIDFEVVYRKGAFDLRPQLNVRIAEPCRKSWRIPIPGGDRGVWQADLNFDCYSNIKKQVKGAPWRLLFENYRGQRVTPEGVKVSLKPLKLDSKRTQLHARITGKFSSNRFEVKTDDMAILNLRWQEDQSPDPVATHMLVATVKPASNRGEKTGDPGSLNFTLHGSRLPKLWPSLMVWLKDPATSRWHEQTLENPQISTSQPLSLDIPEELRGKSLELTALAFQGSYRMLSGREGPYLFIPGRIPDTFPMQLRWIPQPKHRFDIKVADTSGNPLEGAVTAIWLFRDHRELEHQTRFTNEGGLSQIELTHTGNQLQIVCFKQGFRSQRRTLKVSSTSLEQGIQCKLRPEPRQTPLSGTSVVRGQLYDKRNQEPVEGAVVEIQWSPSETPIQTTSKLGGYWWIPSPSPLPPQAQIRVNAFCYRSVADSIEFPLKTPIGMEYLCRNVTLSLKLVQDGSRTVIQHPERARAQVRQGSNVLAEDVRFSADGFSVPVEIGLRLDQGSIQIETQAPGYGPSVQQKKPAELINETGYAPDLVIPLRPTGRGLAVLVNAAESWDAFPRVLTSVTQNLKALGEKEAVPEFIMIGSITAPLLLRGQEIHEPGAFESTLAWLGGLGATRGQLPPRQLVSKLKELQAFWPEAGSWDLLIVVPHLSWASEERVAADDLQTLNQTLRQFNVTVSIIELGGYHKDLAILAEESGGLYSSVGDPVDVASLLVQFFQAFVDKGAAS